MNPWAYTIQRTFLMGLYAGFKFVVFSVKMCTGRNKQRQ